MDKVVILKCIVRPTESGNSYQSVASALVSKLIEIDTKKEIYTELGNEKMVKGVIGALYLMQSNHLIPFRIGIKCKGKSFIVRRKDNSTHISVEETIKRW